MRIYFEKGGMEEFVEFMIKGGVVEDFQHLDEKFYVLVVEYVFDDLSGDRDFELLKMGGDFSDFFVFSYEDGDFTGGGSGFYVFLNGFGEKSEFGESCVKYGFLEMAWDVLVGAAGGE